MKHERYRIAKAPHGSQEWLNQRYTDKYGHRQISASAAAAIYGVHPFVKADQYAAELLSGVAPTPIPPNAAMETGNRLEDTIIQWAGDRLGIKFETPEEMFCYNNTNGARLISTLDGWNEDTKHILEVKTTSREYSGTLPDYWRIQGIQQAICSDANRVTWAIFDNTLRLTLVEQDITEEEMEEHIEASAIWLNAIELGMNPPGITYSYETISTRYQNTTSEPTELDESVADLIAQLKHVKSELASYKALEDKLKAELCDLIGPFESATINGNVVATWKGYKRDWFDSKRFQSENPDLYNQYVKTTTSRTLRLKGE
jgi:predicted phage-related endonuclease